MLALGIEGVAGFLAFLWPLKTGAFGSAQVVPRMQVPSVEGDPYRHTLGKFFLVHPSDGLLALYWKCPHLGCTVPWDDDERRFRCPCHGSIYDYVGRRLAGPAPRPLDLMRVTVLDSGDVRVDTGDIRTRTDYSPQQAVQYLA